MFNGPQSVLRMRIQFLEPSTTVLHLARASRGAAHTICAVNGDEGPGSHNSGCQMGLAIVINDNTGESLLTVTYRRCPQGLVYRLPQQQHGAGDALVSEHYPGQWAEWRK